MGVKYGFDIIADEGTGIAHVINHNLGGIPELIIRKNLIETRNWAVYHHHALNKTDPETDYAIINSIQGFEDLNTIWNDTAPTNTQFTVGTNISVNENTHNFITYLWRSISGFSKVYSYVGNGAADGPFIYTGFRPKYILTKRTTGNEYWQISDAKRDP